MTKTTPLFGALRDTGHQSGGSFLFFLDPQRQVAPAKPVAPQPTARVVTTPTSQLNSLERSRTELTRSIERAERTRAVMNTGGWVSLAGAVVSLGVGGASYLIGTNAMAVYENATTTSAVESARARIDTCSRLLSGSVISGGISISLAPLLWTLRPKPDELRAKLARVESDLTLLRMEQSP